MKKFRILSVFIVLSIISFSFLSCCESKKKRNYGDPSKTQSVRMESVYIVTIYNVNMNPIVEYTSNLWCYDLGESNGVKINFPGGSTKAYYNVPFIIHYLKKPEKGENYTEVKHFNKKE